MLAHPSVFKQLERFKKDHRAMHTRLQRVINSYSHDGSKYLDLNAQFKREGRFSTGGKASIHVVVWVMKGYPQARLYGCFEKFTNNFVCSQFDQKKRDKADQTKLEKTAKMFGIYVEENGK